MTDGQNLVYQVPNGWKLFSVNQIKAPEPNSCVAGPFGSKIASRYFSETGVPVIRGANLRDDLTRFVPEGFVFVSEDRAREYVPQHVRGRDIIFTCWGTIGQVGLIPNDGPFEDYIISNKQLKLRVNDELANPLFCYYYFASPRYVQHIRDRSIGGAVPGINLGILKSLTIALPSRTYQDRIADFLSTYDDLIENNRRRMTSLEEAARLLYREWFVHFRFPGHEHVKIVDGIPEGWKRPAASVVMDILSGGTPKTGNAAFWEGDIGFFTPKDATDTPFVLNTEKTITEEGLRTCNSKLYPTDTLFITARGTVGKLNLALIPMAMNQSCYALRAKSHFGQRYLYVSLKEAIEQVRSRATGAVFDAVIVATFDRISFLLPPENLTVIFEQIINPMFDQIANLLQQNQKLAQARDLLLPRLMNGEIAV